MSDETTTAPTPGPETPVRLTSHELMALFHVAAAPEARRTREALRLPRLADGDDVLAAAFGSLIVRGLVRAEDRRVVPDGPLVGLCAVLFTATRWVEAVGVVGDARHAALVVESPHGTAVLESRPTSIWHAWPVDPQVTPVDAAVGLVAASHRLLTGRPFGGAVTVTDARGDARTAGVRVDADGTWTLAHGPVGAVRGPEPVEADPRFAVIAEALAAGRAQTDRPEL